ncbi:Bax inhibitor-1/YccA family protein [Flavobacterium agricola]|uniref:Bax inhibitor-1/YccA family protein n=1 Tax=Flavobacterium agricola TaxID=2870839 RepID=A0ABY6LX13_9FLAO|nr:Bax inhibitor-1/YccA family protein [Flavobacterium agricola]UYW00875.1 Bax inhibitor-1/YccA family protein [Flavobacterium agricola]
MNFNSNNPFLKNDKFTKEKQGGVTDFNASQTVERYNTIDLTNGTMTIQGTINKSFILLALLLVGAFATWYLTASGYNPIVLTVGGAIVGFVLVLIAAFKPHLSGKLAPGYAIFEGLFIGGISAIFEARYPGIVIQAVGGTFVTFLVCLGLYKFRIVKVNQTFRNVVIAATLAIATYYLISFIASLVFNFQMFHHGSSLMSIGFSAFVIVIAALNLFLDFDLIEDSAAKQQPKFMEWFAAMGLLITLVWLYIEFLRLLSKINSRN